MTEYPGAGSALALIGQIARILNSGLAADETLRAVAATLKPGLPASVAWSGRREPPASRFAGVTVPTGEHAASSLDDLPASDAGTRRYPLVHGGARLGVLEVVLEPPGAQPDAGLMQVLCALLPPFLDAMPLPEAPPLGGGSRS